ncbi:d-beta-hydroxybutyrate dehydrogenase [Stenotrophomonas maltophilia WJ66]|nr:d-beta-hydroxybutyrate dehydrogenase [Stenotrophomonas maltophilia WJ66]
MAWIYCTVCNRVLRLALHPDHVPARILGDPLLLDSPMKIELAGRTALVTASTAGIGLAIAQGLAAAGARVILNGRSTDSVERARQRLLAAVPGAEVIGVAADLSDAAGVDVLLAGLPKVDILVNNAGIFGPEDFFETEDATWERYWQTNVMSGVRLSRALLPAMVDAGWGRVLFISSESARNIPADMIHYGVSKTAQLSLSRGLAKRVAGSGVTVNAVLPGPTLSDGFAAMFEDERQRSGKPLEQIGREFVMAHRPSSVIQRTATVEEVANMVVYLASPQASATSGAALRVDGGVVDDIV